MYAPLLRATDQAVELKKTLLYKRFWKENSKLQHKQSCWKPSGEYYSNDPHRTEYSSFENTLAKTKGKQTNLAFCHRNTNHQCLLTNLRKKKLAIRAISAISVAYRNLQRPAPLILQKRAVAPKYTRENQTLNRFKRIKHALRSLRPITLILKIWWDCWRSVWALWWLPLSRSVITHKANLVESDTIFTKRTKEW